MEYVSLPILCHFFSLSAKKYRRFTYLNTACPFWSLSVKKVWNTYTHTHLSYIACHFWSLSWNCTEHIPLPILGVTFGRFLLKKYGIHTLLYISPILRVTFGLFLLKKYGTYTLPSYVSLLVYVLKLYGKYTYTYMACHFWSLSVKKVWNIDPPPKFGT